MLYDLDTCVYLTRTRYGSTTLIATLEQRRNLLSVLSAYRADSLKDGYACAEPEPATRTRDRARAVQLWNHGVLNQRTLMLCFGVTKRTVAHYWGCTSGGGRPHMYGRINADHCDFLLELLEYHHRHEELPMTDPSVLGILCADPDPSLHTSISAAANLLGVTRQGRPRHKVGLTDETPATPLPRNTAPATPTRVLDLEHLPTQAEVQRAEAVTDLSATDPDLREAVEAGDVPYAPQITLDDTGDSLLAQAGLDDAPDEEDLDGWDTDDEDPPSP